MNITPEVIQNANVMARARNLEVISIFDHDHVVARKVKSIAADMFTGDIEDLQDLFPGIQIEDIQG